MISLLVPRTYRIPLGYDLTFICYLDINTFMLSSRLFSFPHPLYVIGVF